MTTNGCGYDTSNDDARSVTKHERSNTVRILGSKDRYRGCKREEVGGCEKKRRKRTRPSVQLAGRILFRRIIERIDKTIERLS